MMASTIASNKQQHYNLASHLADDLDSPLASLVLTMELNRHVSNALKVRSKLLLRRVQGLNEAALGVWW
jgi:hypothetical protein